VVEGLPVKDAFFMRLWRMRSSRTHSKLLFELDAKKLLATSPMPVFCTLGFQDNVIDHNEASRRWQPVARWMKEVKHVRFVGVWQRQKRGCWHLHLILDRRVDATALRSRAVESGMGSQVDLQFIRRRESDGEHTISKTTGKKYNGNWDRANYSVVHYLCRYLTRDFQKDFGAQLVVRGGIERTGNVRFAWVDGASYAWRLGFAAVNRNVVRRQVFLGKKLGCAWADIGGVAWKDAWKHRVEIFAAGRDEVFKECCAFFDSVAVAASG
jgi:hypothetical protein